MAEHIRVNHFILFHCEFFTILLPQAFSPKLLLYKMFMIHHILRKEVFANIIEIVNVLVGIKV